MLFSVGKKVNIVQGTNTSNKIIGYLCSNIGFSNTNNNMVSHMICLTWYFMVLFVKYEDKHSPREPKDTTLTRDSWTTNILASQAEKEK